MSMTDEPNPMSQSIRAFWRRVFLITLLAMAGPALAQWAWREDNGRVVFSDRPPPGNIKADQIIRQPGVSGSINPIGPSDDARAASNTAPKTLAEREMDYRQRQQKLAETDKKAADERAQAAQRAQECDRMRGYLRTLEDGQRISRTDAQGNREFLDETQRAAEMQRARDQIAKNCSAS